MKLKYYLLTAVLAYLFFLLATVPAKLVLDKLLEAQNGIEVSGVSGTLWHGRASRVEIDNSYQLDDVRWHLVGWRLLTGVLSAEIQATFMQREVSGQAGISLSGTLVAHDIQGAISAEEFAALAALPLVQLDGEMTLAIDSLYRESDAAPVINGDINWRQASLTVAESVALGSVDIRLRENDADGTDITISNQGGALKLDGSGALDAESHYELALTMTPARSASANLVNSLAAFAKKQASGSYLFKTSGQLQLPGAN